MVSIIHQVIYYFINPYNIIYECNSLSIVNTYKITHRQQKDYLTKYIILSNDKKILNKTF